MKRQGLFDLQTPRDLLAKARHDFERLKANPQNAYAAFDFFVAIRHLPNWLYPTDQDTQRREALFSSHVELRVSRHIADGAKHFQVSDKRHNQVAGTSAGPPAFQGSAFQSNSFQVGGLIVELDPQDRDTLRLGSRVSALELAQKVLALAEQVVA